MPKKLIICADGTWNTQQSDKAAPCPTNVERIARALRGEDAHGIPQVVYR